MEISISCLELCMPVDFGRFFAIQNGRMKTRKMILDIAVMHPQMSE
jgi:hypothetical protein